MQHSECCDGDEYARGKDDAHCPDLDEDSLYNHAAHQDAEREAVADDSTRGLWIEVG